ncbi:hypothetical protein AUJ65_01985 [Candidatus Micrarchaeota archaeon CG1_02_51_15]|nr:MAG: hypothetical protein AUJ65_01985 [Candidatus Micrarchaeota archaeon CG1_02_51_15]
MISNAARENLLRDKRVAGRNWRKVYGGYFSNNRVFSAFVTACRSLFAKLPRNPAVLYVCSGNGDLGERLYLRLRQKGFRSSLTLVDASAEQLRENKNAAAEKIVADVLGLRLDRKFDLVIMRSSLDYFPSAAEQVKALKRVALHLKPRGFFVNQCASLRTLEERRVADLVYSSSPKIGRWHFQWKGDLASVYLRAGFSTPKEIGEAPALRLSEKDHAARYAITEKEVSKIRGIIEGAQKTRGVRVTRSGYAMTFGFPIYCARLNK